MEEIMLEEACYGNECSNSEICERRLWIIVLSVALDHTSSHHL